MQSAIFNKSLGLAVICFLLTLQTACKATQPEHKVPPPIKAVTVTGQSISLEQYKGQVVVLDFFATWCSPCRESIPHLVALDGKYRKQGLRVVGLSVDDDAPALKEFIGQQKIGYPVAVADKNLKIAYRISSIPQIIIIDKQGLIVDKFLGFDESAAGDMEKTIKRLLAAK